MKIIRVSTILDFGGVEKRLVNIANSSPNGVKTIFIALGGGGWAASELEKRNKQVICINSKYRIPNILLIAKLVKLFNRLKPDVVHTSGAEANFHAQIAAFIARVPKRISEEIGFPNHSTAFKFIFRNVYKLSHKVVCISEAVADKVIDLGEAGKEKIAVVYNPIDYKEYQRLHSQKCSVIKYITVCRLTEIKNLARLIKVFKVFTGLKPNAVLHIVGDGPEKGKLQELATELSLGDKVKFEGFSQNPVEFLLSADVFVLPSYSEGLGNAIMEAMLVGLPCIVSNVGGGRELIEEGVSGWLIDPYDEDEILRKLLKASEASSEERNEMGLKGKELLREKFSSITHWNSLLKIYQS